jgi:hypothetical protein
MFTQLLLPLPLLPTPLQSQSLNLLPTHSAINSKCA